MNIRKRIESLENVVNVGNIGSSFCGCFRSYYEKMIGKVYDGIDFDETGVELPDGGFCDKCKKPVNTIDTRTIADINKAYEN